MRFVPRWLWSVLQLETPRKITCLVVASAMLTLMIGESRSQDLKPAVRWTVDGASSWNTGSNWAIAGSDPAETGVPGEGEIASVRNGGTAQVTAGVPNVDSLSLSSGTVDIGQGGALTVTGETVIGGSGSLAIGGNGAFTTSLLANSGTVEVNSHDVNVTVVGDFVNAGGLTLNTTGGDPYGIINVSGNASLGGGSIDLATGVAAADLSFGSSWPFMKAGSVSGQPSLITVAGASPSLTRGLGLQVATDGDGNSAVTVGSVPIAIVDRTSGNISVTNAAGGSLDIKGYTLSSGNGLLAPDNWNSLRDQLGDAWTEANPRNQELSEVNLLGSAALNVDGVWELGNAYTGITVSPREEDIGFSYLLADGRVLEGPVEYTGPANDLVLNVNPETGDATLQNLSASVGDFDVTGYSILSASGSLNVAGFTGVGEAGWVIANPQSVALAELTLEGSKVFSNGTVISLGSLFTPGGTQDLTLEFGTTTFDLLPGTVEYGGAPPMSWDCNGDGVIDVTDLNCTAAADAPAFFADHGFIPGDLTGDGAVAFPDFLILSANFTMAGQYTDGDINFDGTVNFPDFLVLSANFGQSAGAAAASVPEPATGMLVLVGLLGLLKFRRHAHHVLGILLVLGLLSTSQPAWAQTDFDTHFIRIHPEGPNNQINNTTEARGIENGTIIDVIKNEDLVGKLDLIDLAGGAGTFNVDNPYLNGVSNDSMIDFLQYVSGTLTIPAGDWSIGFGSDDGAFLNMPGVSFIETFNENGAGADGDGEIFFNGTRGHAWTAGTFTVPAGGITTGFESLFFERGGGDSFEVAILDGFVVDENEIRDFGFELEDGSFDWKVTGDPFGGGTPGDFNNDGVVDTADYTIMTDNFGTGTSFGQGDFNGDGAVDLVDAGEFAAVFPTPVGATAGVPEPGSLSLLLMATAGFLGARRRRVRR